MKNFLLEVWDILLYAFYVFAGALFLISLLPVYVCFKCMSAAQQDAIINGVKALANGQGVQIGGFNFGGFVVSQEKPMNKDESKFLPKLNELHAGQIFEEYNGVTAVNPNLDYIQEYPFIALQKSTLKVRLFESQEKCGSFSHPDGAYCGCLSCYETIKELYNGDLVGAGKRFETKFYSWDAWSGAVS